MNTQTIYQLVKVLHIYGFITTIGITTATLIAYQQFWRQYAAERTHGITIFQVIQKLQIAGMVGMITVLLAGFAMLAIHSGFASLLWFQVKLGIIVLIFLNGLTSGRTSALGLRALIAQEQKATPPDTVPALKRRVQRFTIIQLVLFSTIVILSVFRFG